MKRLVISVLVTVAIIAFLFSQISLKDLYTLFLRINVFWAFWGAVCYLVSVFFRAVRFKWLVHSEDLPLLPLSKISILYNLALMVLPARLGEFSYPYLLNRYCGITMTEGMASLIATRIYDLLVTFMIFLVAATKFQGIFQTAPLGFVLFAGILTGLTLVVLFHMDRLLAWISSGLRKVSSWVGPKKNVFLPWVLTKVEELSKDFRAIKTKRSHLSVTFVTILSWLMAFWMFHAFLKSFGISISLSKMVFASMIAILANALPVSALGNWGVLEAGWAAGFLLVGLPKETAIATGFGVHILIFVVTVAVGIPCWLSLGQKSPSLPAP